MKKLNNYKLVSGAIDSRRGFSANLKKHDLNECYSACASCGKEYKSGRMAYVSWSGYGRITSYTITDTFPACGKCRTAFIQGALKNEQYESIKDFFLQVKTLAKEKGLYFGNPEDNKELPPKSCPLREVSRVDRAMMLFERRRKDRFEKAWVESNFSYQTVEDFYG